MPKYLMIIALGSLLCLPPTLAGEEAPQTEVQKILDEAQKALYSAQQSGMNGLTADLQIEAEGLDNPWTPDGRKGLSGKLMNLETTYSWGVGNTGEVVITKGVADQRVSGGIQKALKEHIKELWRGIAGIAIPEMPTHLEPTVTTEGGEKVIHFNKKDRQLFAWRFDATTKLIVAVEQLEGKRTTTTTYAYTKVEKYTVLSSIRTTMAKGNEMASESVVTWDNFRQVNGRPLPTTALVDRNGKPIKIRIDYTTINGGPAEVKAPTKDEVKDLASVLSMAFRSNDLVEKHSAIQAAKDAGTPHAAVLLAKYINDRDAGLDVIKALGQMEHREVLPALTSAFSRYRKDMTRFEAICWAMGRLGDPRAVKTLANNIWSGAGSGGWRQGAKARIEALGDIRHTASVDALVDMLGDTRRRWNNNIHGDVYRSLAKLTGQRFRDQRSWKDWWKKNRSHFRF